MDVPHGPGYRSVAVNNQGHELSTRCGPDATGQDHCFGVCVDRPSIAQRGRPQCRQAVAIAIVRGRYHGDILYRCVVTTAIACSCTASI